MNRFILLSICVATACSRADTAADTTAAIDSSRIGATTQAAGAQPSTASTAGGSVATTLVDPNSATREQLAGAGVDSAAIIVIMAGRPYADMLAFDRAVAAKMNSDQRKALYSKVWRPIDINTAKGDEILMIPGVGPKMRHEFEEYRPYRNIEQFRREIGKYVDKAEVARLEQYIVVK